LPELAARRVELRAAVLTRLAELNQDYREAARFMPAKSVPTLEPTPPVHGPFAGHDVRLKRHYILSLKPRIG
jgi:hypothetical protein